MSRIFSLLSSFSVLVLAITVEASSIQHDDIGTKCPANQTYGFGCELQCITHMHDNYLDCRHQDRAGCVCNQGYCRTYTGDKLECLKVREVCESHFRGKEVVSCDRIQICTGFWFGINASYCDFFDPPGGWPSPRAHDEPAWPSRENNFEQVDCPENEVLGIGCEVDCTHVITWSFLWNCVGQEEKEEQEQVKPRCLCDYRHCREENTKTCVKRDSIEHCWPRSSQFARVEDSIWTDRHHCQNKTIPGGWPSPRPVIGLEWKP